MTLPRSTIAHFLIILPLLVTSSEEPFAFNPGEIKSILQALNEIRGQVNPTAANMQQLIWNEELQRAASNYTSECAIHHNLNRTDGLSFKTAGQTTTSSDRANFQQLVQAWKRHSYNVTSNKCKGDAGLCNYYMQVVSAESLYVGCGASLCTNAYFTVPAVFFSCYYTPQLSAGMRPYLEGPPCSACREDQDYCVNNLCVGIMATECKTANFSTTQAYDDDNDTDIHEEKQTRFSYLSLQEESHASRMSSMPAMVLTLIGLNTLSK